MIGINVTRNTTLRNTLTLNKIFETKKKYFLNYKNSILKLQQ